MVTSFRSVVPWAAQRGSHIWLHTSNAWGPPAKPGAYLNRVIFRYLAIHEGEPPTGDFHPHPHAHAGRIQSAAPDRLQPTLVPRSGFQRQVSASVTATRGRGLYCWTLQEVEIQ